MKIASKLNPSSGHFLSTGYVYFHGTTGRCKETTTLTASIYHPLLKKQVPLAILECPSENSQWITMFWSLFIEGYQEVNGKGSSFEPKGWISDMAGANMEGLRKVFGEEVLSKIKGCEWHYKDGVNKRAKQLRDCGGTFKKLAHALLEAETKEGYERAKQILETFISAEKSRAPLQNWLKWWDERRYFAFRAFSDPSAPRSNLAEVIHAGWVHRDSRGLSPLESAYCDTRDSILLESEISLFETGAWKGGHGPNFDQVDARKNSRTEERAATLGAELANLSSMTETQRNGCRIDPNAGHKPPVEDKDTHMPKKRERRTRLKRSKAFIYRLKKAKYEKNNICIKRVISRNSDEHTYEICSSRGDSHFYSVQISTTPSCSCPDFRTMVGKSSCKHILWILLNAYLVPETSSLLQQMAFLKEELNELLKGLPQTLPDDLYASVPKFANPQASSDDPCQSSTNSKSASRPLASSTPQTKSHSLNKSRTEAVKIILQSHPSYNAPQDWLYTVKKSRSAMCRGCRDLIPKNEICVEVRGALTVPYQKDFAVTGSTFYYCPKLPCISSCPPWTNLRVPVLLQVDRALTEAQIQLGKDRGLNI